MRIGVVFPQTEIGADPSVVRDYAETAEGLGYKQLLAYDHILGAGLANRPEWRGAYSEKDQFHEIFVLFSHMAAITQSIEFVTGVLVLPIRETALVAKQAASIDVLSGGRVRIGVGVGWNEVESQAMNADFHTRGKRVEEQIEVLRLLWTKPVVNFQGRWHNIPEAGLNPMPVQQPIPIWVGGYTEAVLRRAARLADGYFPAARPPDQAREVVETFRAYAQEAGRDPDSLGLEPRISLRMGDASLMRQYIEAWRMMGATHLDIDTMGQGLKDAQHIEAIRKAYDDLGLAEYA
jgi:probable F420-dependent oxidoreductase